MILICHKCGRISETRGDAGAHIMECQRYGATYKEILLFEQRNRVVARREERRPCGGVKRIYTVERRDDKENRTKKKVEKDKTAR